MDVEAIINKIRNAEDITLKIITDLVAFKNSESKDYQGADLNLISVHTSVAEYVSTNFRNKKELVSKLSKLGKGLKGLNAFADITYNH